MCPSLSIFLICIKSAMVSRWSFEADICNTVSGKAALSNLLFTTFNILCQLQQRLRKKKQDNNFLRWQLSLNNESTPSLVPVTRELVMDKLGSSVRTSDLALFTFQWSLISLSEEPFVEDDHIEGGGGVGDEVTEHIHLCNRIFQES